MNIEKEFYKKLSDEKIKINRNKKPIKMELFLSFLTINTKRDDAYRNGWTFLENEEHKLTIGGGIVNSIEYLDTIQYGRNLSNVWNNFVNPFYLFDKLTIEGQKFFVEYYKDDIEQILETNKNKIESLEEQLKEQKNITDEISNEINILYNL